MPKTTNKLLPIAAGIVVLAVLGLFTLSGGAPEDQDASATGTKTGSDASGAEDDDMPDTDLPADTLRVLTEKIETVGEDVSTYKAALAQRDAEVRQLKQQLQADQSRSRLTSAPPASLNVPEPEPTLVDDMIHEIARPYSDPNFMAPPSQDRISVPPPTPEMLIGGAPELAPSQPTSSGSRLPGPTSSKYRRHYPVGYPSRPGFQTAPAVSSSPGVQTGPRTEPDVQAHQKAHQDKLEDTLGYLTGSAQPPNTSVHAANSGTPVSDLEPRPYATIPQGASLIGAITLSSLIARVPKRGNVEDPVEFQVLIGAENLAANGMMIPGLEGMVMSGTTVGDATFSCARGYITSTLFVFDDGTISTARSDSGSGSTARSSQNNLGYLADVRGNNCVPGKYVSNAAENLLFTASAQGAAGVASGVAEAQTTTIQNSNGASSQNVDGSLSNFLFGKFANNAANAVSQYFADHQSSQWDAVYVPAGVSVLVRVQQTIHIDYDPKARKLSYPAFRRPGRRGGLD